MAQSSFENHFQMKMHMCMYINTYRYAHTVQRRMNNHVSYIRIILNLLWQEESEYNLEFYFILQYLYISHSSIFYTIIKS